ncbi:TIGR02270 family protein [Archangium sp.]|uniref:TIGR02270 family protein n=1 Tax=Archangium sp. TaxID=1872627 RepID=UPI002D6587D1|nr:TIGR02270 family protein [Archangium sp.]HYO54547.1 TIGR02270 family protein [Archangium sp.]
MSRATHIEPPWWDIAEEHLSEATFLWSKWEQALSSPAFTLAEAAEREERLRAHLDGLVLGGAMVAERMLKPALAEEDPFLVAAASCALLDGGQSLDMLLAETGLESAVQWAGVQRALEFCEREGLPAQMLALLSRSAPPARVCILGALGARGVEAGPELERLLSSDEPVLVSNALKVVRNSASSPIREQVRRLLGSPLPDIRAAALETGVALGLRGAWLACQQFASEDDAAGQRARLLMAMGGETPDIRALLALLGVPELRQDVLWVLGFSGRVAAADACVELLGEPDSRVARLAAESFCAITGLVLEGRYVRHEPRDAADELVPLEEEDLDEPLVLRSEDELLLAEPNAVRTWWREARHGFEPEGRYLHGKPARLDQFLEVLRGGPMRRHHVLALELAIRSQGRLFLQTSGGWRRQLRQMEEIQAMRGAMSFGPFRLLCQQN